MIFPFFHFDREKIAPVYFYEVLSLLFLLIEFQHLLDDFSDFLIACL